MCLRARAPATSLILTGANRSSCAACSCRECFRSGEGCALVCGGTRAPSSPSGTRQVMSPDVKHTLGQGRTVFALPRLSFHDRPALRRAHFCVQSTAAGHCSAACAHFCVSHKALRRLHSVLFWGLCTFFCVRTNHCNRACTACTNRSTAFSALTCLHFSPVFPRFASF